MDGSVLIQAGILATEQMYFSAALIMLPIALILLLINVAIGVITRSAPTLNLFSFGFPITMLGVFFISPEFHCRVELMLWLSQSFIRFLSLEINY